MEASRGKGPSHRGSAARGSAAAGKENICPALRSKDHLGASRSPLPEGFPRAPLQDITHVLSPINILPDYEGEASTELGQCRHGRKRPKCGAETHSSTTCTTRSECEHSASEAWRGLRKCVTLQATNSDVLVTSKLKLTEVVEVESFTHAGASTGLIDAAKHPTASMELIEEAVTTHAVEIKEEALLCRETRDTEVLKSEAEETSKSARAKPKRPAKLSASGSSTRASLRSLSEKQKMSSLMKFR